MIYLELFISFIKIGLFSFGGGYASLPLIRNEVVLSHQWLSNSEFTDLITISQMTPGPIAINSATFVGIQIAGIPGAIAATIGCILPSCIIVFLLSYIYVKYSKMELMNEILLTLRPAVIALIAGAGVGIIKTAFFGESTPSLSHIQPDMVIIFVVAYILIRAKKLNPILIMFACGGVRLIISYL